MMANVTTCLADDDDEPESLTLGLKSGGVAEVMLADARWGGLICPALRGRLAAGIDRCLAVRDIGGLTDIGGITGPVDAPVDVALLLADDAVLAQLNERYRGTAKPTNVLAFPDNGGGGNARPDAISPDDARKSLGDIAIAYDTLMREAASYGRAPGDHLLHLVIHGVLHLCGHDHTDDAAASRMERLEADILAHFGIANPYQDIR